MEYKSAEEWARAIVAKQPAFKRQEDAVEAAMKKIATDEDYPQIWQAPDDGEFVVANYQAFEALYRLGYKKIIDPVFIRGMVEAEKK